MIRNRWRKAIAVAQCMCHDLEDARPYGDRMLALYLGALRTRREYGDVPAFLALDQNLWMVYQLLDVWDRNTGDASMVEYIRFSDTVDRNLSMGNELLDTFDMASRSTTPTGFRAFCESMRACGNALAAVEVATERSYTYFRKTLGAVYDDLPLVQSSKHIVSNAMLLHLLFPDHLMPVDGQHTLSYLYGRETVLPTQRYLEVIDFQQELQELDIDWNQYLDERWNSTVPKLVDNAIIFLRRKALVEQRLQAEST